MGESPDLNPVPDNEDSPFHGADDACEMNLAIVRASLEPGAPNEGKDLGRVYKYVYLRVLHELLSPLDIVRHAHHVAGIETTVLHATRKLMQVEAELKAIKETFNLP